MLAILWFFYKIKVRKHPWPMLPPGKRNWQLFTLFSFFMNHLLNLPRSCTYSAIIWHLYSSEFYNLSFCYMNNIGQNNTQHNIKKKILCWLFLMLSITLKCVVIQNVNILSIVMLYGRLWKCDFSVQLRLRLRFLNFCSNFRSPQRIPPRAARTRIFQLPLPGTNAIKLYCIVSDTRTE